ncbi:MAG: hypothetical protein H6587_05675 [Flavobacteriales bacterium]|nr:hypothetical protein [Flavobacteriales bacterium]MCB9364040.1 hypothetical protein [Flavobacteriales bacterium]
MIKYLILFIHLVGLSFYQLIFGDVSVSQNLPSTFNTGEEVVVEVVVKKDGVGGFAKVQQTLPEGFLAEVIDAKGATFSFKDNIVKFIWMALPSENEFKVSYKLKTLDNIEGNFSIAGKFSFIDENERKNIEIPPSSVTISKVEMVAEESVEEVIEEPIAKIIEEEPVIEEEIVTPTIEETVAENKSVEINCVRNIKKNNDDNNYEVTVKISQTNLEGFAKIVETIPSGFSAEAIETKGGVFSFKENEAKILWMAAPTDKEFEISYKIIANSAIEKTYTINGAFSYLDNDITQKFLLNSTEFKYTKSIQEEEVVAEVIEPTTESESIEEPEIEESTPIIEEQDPIIEETYSSKQDETTTSKITSTPQPETGISYKVQVGAGHQKVSANYFAVKYNLTDKVATESHQGWIKYVVGSYSDYKSARDKRNTVRSNVKTAFVTAYNQGARITVQEALMISNQKWYK